MSPLLLTILVFVSVAGLVGAVALMLTPSAEAEVEERLDVYVGGKKSNKEPMRNILATSLEATPGLVGQIFQRFSRLGLLFEQADTNLNPSTFGLITMCLAGVGWVAAWVAGSPIGIYPVAALLMACLPSVWLIWRRRKRLNLFASQLPDALELMARALRAGHSLGASFQLVQTEGPEPIATEFGRVFEEQNLGISTEESLRNMTDRVPNLDLKFFATAIILQRQTGGDLAEILDKIGNLIRERFKIYGQVQALTGEGRLSGVVLLGLPPLLFGAVYHLNPDYVMILFEDPMGKKMIAGAAFMQLLGALVIRKIVNIKV